ncbi:low affinity iron permease family protein [Glycomyces tritici]|uniref:Low affinity iron permease family protein n=1 Tax=Glycomyces tritici TaxID=2665176 RepID=A0ABT7YIM9_9ACTN|nr:low affinity iron permease family protein [Glycomyces tritici]MDN3238294.1 low affinity iron permease family protein [Glycomyces tritici]
MKAKEHESERPSATMPRDIDDGVSWFDRFATRASEFAARAPFFSMCILVVLLWAPSIVWLDMSTWQLIINTTTTIITFLMVALLQNTESRNDAALQHKLNAIASGLADVLQQLSDASGDPDLEERRKELRRAVGLEDDESA